MLSASPNFVSHKFQRDTQWVWARIMFVYARELHFYVLSASWGCGAMDYNCGHSISRRSRLGRLGGDPNSTLHYTTAGCTHSTRLNGSKSQWFATVVENRFCCGWWTMKSVEFPDGCRWIQFDVHPSRWKPHLCSSLAPFAFPHSLPNAVFSKLSIWRNYSIILCTAAILRKGFEATVKVWLRNFNIANAMTDHDISLLCSPQIKGTVIGQSEGRIEP